MDRRCFIRNCLATGIGGIVLAELGFSASTVLGIKQGADSVDRGDMPIRPPGALAEAKFLQKCIRCMRCIDACPNHALIALGDEFGEQRRGTPHLKPRRQACMLCNRMEGEYLKCTKICPTGALEPIEKTLDEITAKVAMGKAHIDKALCYSYNNWSCGACYRACPLPGHAMTVGLWEKPEVNQENCVGCGACERSCIRYPQAVRVKSSNSI